MKIKNLLRTLYTQKPFRILPGHKTLILAIPKKIKDIEQVKTQKKASRGNKENVQISEIEIEELKTQLTEKLEKFCENIKLHLQLQDGDFSNFF